MDDSAKNVVDKKYRWTILNAFSLGKWTDRWWACGGS